MQNNEKWEYNKISKEYHVGNVYLTEKENSIEFFDPSDLEFFEWETSSWIEIADNKELM